MVAFRLPDPKMQLFDNNGNPLAGGFVYTYEAGTLNPLDTWTDYNQNALNENPIELDSAGRASVWFGDTQMRRRQNNLCDF